MATKHILIEPKSDNPIHQGLHVLQRLRDAGVPVIGVLWPMGVESGVLSVGVPDLADGIVEDRMNNKPRLHHSRATEQDAHRYRALIQLGTLKAARTIEELGTGRRLDEWLDGIKLDPRATELRNQT